MGGNVQGYLQHNDFGSVTIGSERKLRRDGSITDCPLPVFAKSATLLAEKCAECTHLYSSRSARGFFLARETISRPAVSPPNGARGVHWPCDRCCRKLAFAVNDSAFGQIVRRQFDPNPVARHDADKMLAHPTGNVGHNDVSTLDLNAKSSIGQGLRHSALDLKCFFLLFCHTRLCPMNEMGQPAIVEPAPVRSPLRLAESYNPSIGMAGQSSQVAWRGQGFSLFQTAVFESVLAIACCVCEQTTYDDNQDIARVPL